ncbi:MAG TPA: hypothetical protein VLM11_11995 [Streptosporangiaceae bacterium]|nr:hypothetical protein [Streptosporangiaceae bacterium]
MDLPEPVIGLLFPAQRYLRRRREQWLREHRRSYPSGQPDPVAPEDDQQAAADEAAPRTWRQAVRDHRLAKIHRIARDQDKLLRSKADELARTGAAVVVTASGEISARIIRFRWGPDVIEISRSQAGENRGGSRSLLARSPASDRSEQIHDNLVQALAALESAPPPPATATG